jgi:hypothetical protein
LLRVKRFFIFMFKISITGGDERIRTADICRAKAALYQLSYIPKEQIQNQTRNLAVLIEDLAHTP